jgi:hypothetical protein
MLRRYIIVNGLSTVAMYGAIWAAWPVFTAQLNAMRSGFETYAMENPLLGPLVHRIVLMIGG